MSAPAQFIFRRDRVLGEGSTAAVYLAEALHDLSAADESTPDAQWSKGGAKPALLRVNSVIRRGEQVVLKSSAISMERIGSYSAGGESSGCAPPNYPTGFSTVVRERLVGDALAEVRGEAKEHIVPLLASWVDDGRLWLAMGLVRGCDVHGLLEPRDEGLAEFVRQPCASMLRLMRQMALAVECLAANAIVWRDGGLQNWMISDKPDGASMTMVDFGLAIQLQAPLRGADTYRSLLTEPGRPPPQLSPEQVAQWRHEGEPPQRLIPNDFFYSPGAASPKYPAPPECVVLRDDVPSDCQTHALLKSAPVAYTPGYDVWVLAWTWIQMVVGERWCDYKRLATSGSDEPLGALLKAHFFDKKLMVEAELIPGSGEAGAQVPPAYRLAINAQGEAYYHALFLEPFFKIIGERLRHKGSPLTPMQAALLDNGSTLRKLFDAMLSFDPKRRADLALSGRLHLLLEDLISEHSAQSKLWTKIRVNVVVTSPWLAGLRNHRLSNTKKLFRETSAKSFKDKKRLRYSAVGDTFTDTAQDESPPQPDEPPEPPALVATADSAASSHLAAALLAGALLALAVLGPRLRLRLR